MKIFVILFLIFFFVVLPAAYIVTGVLTYLNAGTS